MTPYIHNFTCRFLIYPVAVLSTCPHNKQKLKLNKLSRQMAPCLCLYTRSAGMHTSTNCALSSRQQNLECVRALVYVLMSFSIVAWRTRYIHFIAILLRCVDS